MKKKFRTKRERERAIADFDRAERVKMMRSITGDTFSAKSGFDLRRPASWTPAQKAKVTKYFRTLAPFVTDTGETKKIKRYRRPDRLEAAILQTGQEKLLKGQTAAVFRAPEGQEISVTVDRRTNDFTVTKGGTKTDYIRFNKAAFIEDPQGELDRVLGQTDAQLFRLMTGAYEQNKVMRKPEILDEIFRLLSNYGGRKEKQSRRMVKRPCRLQGHDPDENGTANSL